MHTGNLPRRSQGKQRDQYDRQQPRVSCLHAGRLIAPLAIAGGSAARPHLEDIGHSGRRAVDRHRPRVGEQAGRLPRPWRVAGAHCRGACLVALRMRDGCNSQHEFGWLEPEWEPAFSGYLSITLVAFLSTDSGIANSIARAAARFRVVLFFLTNWKGREAGLSPCMTRAASCAVSTPPS